MTEPTERRAGVVLSGGGAGGAYEVGVLKALLSGRSPATGYQALVPGVCAGTSIGSFNAAFLVSRLADYGAAAAGDLERVWVETLASTALGFRPNGVYRLRGNPLAFADPWRYVPNPFGPFVQAGRDSTFLLWDGLNRLVNLATNDMSSIGQRLGELVDLASLLVLDPFARSIRETIDCGKIRDAAIRLHVAATNWTTGKLTVFKNQDMTDRTGPLAILASSSIPGILPPVLIGAEPHVDGGVLINTPLTLVTRNAEVIHMIYLDPDVTRISLGALQSTLGALYRQQLISWAQIINDDIEDARSINRSLEVLAKLRAGGSIPDESIQSLATGLDRVFKRQEEMREGTKAPYRLLTIHRYHPRDDLSGGFLGLLNFNRDHVSELIERGFADAAAHDCEVSGCVLPESASARAEE